MSYRANKSAMVFVGKKKKREKEKRALVSIVFARNHHSSTSSPFCISIRVSVIWFTSSDKRSTVKTVLHEVEPGILGVMHTIASVIFDIVSWLPLLHRILIRYNFSSIFLEFSHKFILYLGNLNVRVIRWK